MRHPEYPEEERMKDLSNKNILITGAGSGIGRLMAHYVADERANTALIDINATAVNTTVEEVKRRKVKAAGYVCDISNPKAVSDTVAKIKEDFGPIHVLINNAGTVVGKSFFDLSIEEMQRTMNINYWGHVYFTKALIGEMTARGSGAIVNVASSSGLLGMPILSDYAASKFAEVGFSESLRRELKKFKHTEVKVTCVCPYIIDTGLFKGFKPMVMSPFIKPEDAARAIVEGLKKGKPYVMLPPLSIYGSLVLKLLPTPIFDWLLSMSGGSVAMDSFTGRK
jgi:all-trans-retinol dehydrogenase (NAD+)